MDGDSLVTRFSFDRRGSAPYDLQGNSSLRGDHAIAITLDDNLQAYLTRSNVEWIGLDESAQFAAERQWRSIYVPCPRRVRTWNKAEYDYLREPCTHFLIVPFTSDADGYVMHVYRRAIGAYECRGNLVPLGEFCDAEFFVCPLSFDWTMVHTHEDCGNGGYEGPYFIRRAWIG